MSLAISKTGSQTGNKTGSLISIRHPLASTAEQLRVLESRAPRLQRFSGALAASALYPLRSTSIQVLQVNVGKLCNQTCGHCHVDAGPDRRESMTRETAELCLEALEHSAIPTLDITGGAPELSPHFRDLVGRARALGVHVIDRCNLTILEEPGQHDLAEFLAAQGVEVVASLPCYTEELVDRQRGKGVYDASLRGLQRLNALGYGKAGSGLLLNLVYNPQGANLPPGQAALEQDYKRVLFEAAGIEFNRLYTLANMPIARFGSMLISKGQFNAYMSLLHQSFSAANLETVMCRSLLSVDWQGYVYDCDFNQMLGLPLVADGNRRLSLKSLLGRNLEGNAVVVKDHCYGCTAGQGSSCGGALA